MGAADPVVGHDPHHAGPGHFPTPAPKMAPHDTVPEYGSLAHLEKGPTPFDPEKPMPPPRTIWQRYRQVLTNWQGDPDMPAVGGSMAKKNRKSWWAALTGPYYPMKPELYRDPYLRPNTCPEEYIFHYYRWPMHREVNPKIPPPVDGKYNDFFHYFAFKHWLARERDVYMAHCNLVHEMSLRCTLREGPINAPKNCRHLVNKFFAMTRMEELNSSLLYMAITGKNVIRETPYPENFVEQKRKIYDDWLFRTRLRKPGDPF